MPLFFLIFASVLALPVVWPPVDFVVSGVFYHAGQGFFLADNVVLLTLHWVAYYGARALGLGFALCAFGAKMRSKPIGGCDSKAWGFLLLALLIGPVLVANVGFKDHWGRARPREVVEFGGAAQFSPALEPHFEKAHSNGSFVSGDGAFGFFLPAFAFAVPRRASRRVFWGTMTAGAAFGFVRIAMGAHFFSDVVYAAAFMLASTSLVHAALYGRRETLTRWRGFFTRLSAG